jgi:hypothetical protein
MRYASDVNHSVWRIGTFDQSWAHASPHGIISARMTSVIAALIGFDCRAYNGPAGSTDRCAGGRATDRAGGRCSDDCPGGSAETGALSGRGVTGGDSDGAERQR